MRFTACWILAIVGLCGLAKCEETEPSEHAVIEGDWGRLVCTPFYRNIYQSSGKEILLLPGLGDTRRPESICDVELFGTNGKEVAPIDKGPTYLIGGVPEKVTIKSMNPKVVSVVDGTDCVFGTSGKAVLVVKFGKKTSKLTVNVVRTKIDIGSTPTQVAKIVGKPSLRFNVRSKVVKFIGGTAITTSEDENHEVWRWERQEELEVRFTASGYVLSVKSAPFPTDEQVKELSFRLIEDSRGIKKNKPNK